MTLSWLICVTSPAIRKVLHLSCLSKDAIFVGGGNTFYLRWLLRDTGADEVITRLVRSGLVYAGANAGAIVAGPTLKYFDKADDPKAAPEVIWDGLGLCDTVVVPHMGTAHYGPIVEKANELLIADGYTTAPIDDDGEFVVDD
jgi:dipeptidase E